MSHGPDQQRLDFNPIEATPEERARMKRMIDQWTLEEEAEDFKQLPCETLSEFMVAREQHLRTVEAFGLMMPQEPSKAWQMVHGQSRPPPAPPRQLKLPLDPPKPSP